MGVERVFEPPVERGGRRGQNPEGTDFGQSRFGHPDLTKSIWIVCVCHGGAQRVGPTQKNRAPKVGAPKGGPRRVGEQNFTVFFSFFRPHSRSFYLSLGVFSWNFGGVSSARALSCARLEFSGCHVKPRRPRSRAERIGPQCALVMPLTGTVNELHGAKVAPSRCPQLWTSETVRLWEPYSEWQEKRKGLVSATEISVVLGLRLPLDCSVAVICR